MGRRGPGADRGQTVAVVARERLTRHRPPPPVFPPPHAQPLELWGHQASPFVGMVREAMCSMELPYLYHNIPFGATKVRQKAARARRRRGAACGGGMSFLRTFSMQFPTATRHLPRALR